jgi:DUF1365 family protein
MTAAIYRTSIRHVRQDPLKNAFTYRSYSWYVDLDDLPQLPWWLRPSPVSMRRTIWGIPRRASAKTWTASSPERRRARRRYGHHAGQRQGAGPRLQPDQHLLVPRRRRSAACCHRRGPQHLWERHCYLLHPDGAGRVQTSKDFFVSPFNEVDGSYRMSLPAPTGKLAVAVVLERAGRKPLTATMTGVRRTATPRSILAAALAVPLAPLRVVLQIRWQGIKLWARGLPIINRPHHPAQEAVS